MGKIDHYAVLGVSRHASRKQIQEAYREHIKNVLAEAEQFTAAFVIAYETLSNPYRRARYDKTLGYFMTVYIYGEVKPSPADTAVYLLRHKHPVRGLHQVIELFKQWLQDNRDMSWDEALASDYGCELMLRQPNSPFLSLHFPRQQELDAFARYLQAQVEIKSLMNSNM